MKVKYAMPMSVRPMPLGLRSTLPALMAMNVGRGLCMAMLIALTPARSAQVTSLAIQGVEYRSACSPSEWNRLKAQIAEASAGRQDEVLTGLVFTILCGRGARADGVMRQASLPLIERTIADTGPDQPVVGKIAREQLRAYAAAAWSASAQASDEGVQVNFYRNEACIEALEFRRVGSKTWRLVALTQACD